MFFHEGTFLSVFIHSNDGFVGVQTIAKFANTLNAKQYMQMPDERVVNEGQPAFVWEDQIPAYLLDKVNTGWEGTDWQGEAYSPSLSQNPSVNITEGILFPNSSWGRPSLTT